jgi:glycosyltransferase involved in cell wall biosynthesis
VITKVLISFIVPFQNFEVLRGNMLNSFQESMNGIEVIFVHDSKIELNQDQLRDLALPSKNGRYFCADFNSPGLARNKGLEEAKGEWIAFWDSDDFAYPSMIPELLARGKPQILIANFCVTQGSDEKLKSRKNYRVCDAQIVANPGLWRFIFAHKVIANCRFRSLKLGEDILFLIESGALERRITLAQETIYEYHISPLQSTNKGNMKLAPNMEQFITELVGVIKLNQPNSKLTYAIYWRQILSLLKVSKGKRLLFCVMRTVSLIRSLNPQRKLAFFKGLRLALRRGRV